MQVDEIETCKKKNAAGEIMLHKGSIGCEYQASALALKETPVVISGLFYIVYYYYTFIYTSIYIHGARGSRKKILTFHYFCYI